MATSPNSKIIHGARAIVQINGKSIGIFTTVSYGQVYDVSSAFILGRFSPAELAYTAAEAIQVSCSGYRVVDNGPHSATGGSIPHLQELLNANDITLALFDRQTNKKIMSVVGCKSQGYSTSVSHRQMQEITINYLGLRLSDESGQNGEGVGAASLP